MVENSFAEFFWIKYFGVDSCNKVSTLVHFIATKGCAGLVFGTPSIAMAVKHSHRAIVPLAITCSYYQLKSSCIYVVCIFWKFGRVYFHSIRSIFIFFLIAGERIQLLCVPCGIVMDILPSFIGRRICFCIHQATKYAGTVGYV